jgi:hypothetical protein
MFKELIREAEEKVSTGAFGKGPGGDAVGVPMKWFSENQGAHHNDRGWRLF